MKPFISTAFYGVLNYIIALTMIASPWLFDLLHVSNAAFLMPMYFGWLQLIMAIFADNELSPIRKFPMQMHLTIDVMVGFLIAVSPWLYTFSSKAFWPEVLIGGLLIFLGLFTKKSPFTTKAHHSLPEGQLTSTDSTEGRLSI
jgi:SPW repeat